ncbi:MAG TPA: ABC transporter permease [Candidatus Tyrphobacter sp.]
MNLAAFDATGLAAVMYKEVRHILREPTTLALIIAMPLMQLLIYGYAINLHVDHIASVYYNEDRGRAAGLLVKVLGASQTFHLVQSVASREELTRALVAGRAHVAFDIPAHFSTKLARGKTVAVPMLVDGSDASVAQAAYGAATRIGDAFSQWSDPLGESAAVEIRPRTLFNPSLRTPNFLIPGLIGLVMQNITMVLTALSIVNERERGTLDQMRVTPIGPAAVILGKLIPYGAVGFFDLLLVLVAMRFVFNVPIAGSIWLLLLLSAAFLLTCLGLGLLISTVARSQLQAILIAVFFLLPSFLLSGMFFEVDLMPAPARIISYALPMTYFLEVLRGIVIRGATLAELWVPAAVTVAFGLGMLALASFRFAARSSQ